VNAAFNALLSDSVSAIVLQRQQRLLIGPTGTSVVIPWLTAQLLSALSEQSPQFVEAKRLQALVWPDTHISADALKQRVRLARQALREAGYDTGRWTPCGVRAMRSGCRSGSRRMRERR